MTYEEVEKAAGKGLPVLYEDKVRGFKTTGQITAVIHRYVNGEKVLRAEVKKIHENSVIVCSLDCLSLWDGKC